MKADIYRMDEACAILNDLRARILQIEDTVQEIRKFLSDRQLGSAVNTAAINTSLLVQADMLHRRAEGMELMIRALRSARNQYEDCETKAAGMSVDTQWKAVAPIYQFYDKKPVLPEAYILRVVEQETIARYIKPLMAGKKETI